MAASVAYGGLAAAGAASPSSRASAFWLGAVSNRLMSRLSHGQSLDPYELWRLCISLAKGIDYAVANNEFPESVHELPVLIKYVYRRLCNNESLLQSAIMVLMISVKNACKNRWFLDKDVNDLLSLANEIGRNFSYPVDTNIEPTDPPHIFSKVMSRFLPRMKMGRILALLEVKAGFESFAVDFQILKSMLCAAQKNFRLFVIQADTLTSSCLISPPHVNFYLNGRPVDRRNTLSIDTGPQLPTNVTSMLRFGINLLQAVGQFTGDYIIAVAFMSLIPSPDVPVLQDYVPLAASSLESDSEIIEGPSRISLNCPISFKRIKTPAKGHLCKHLQCFDYENFVDINSRRPSWRCPHCNQSVCFLDLRGDRHMAKVLEEVGESVNDVIISADGSWKPAGEPDCSSLVQGDDTPLNEDGMKQCEPGRISDAAANIVDLTLEGIDDDPMDILEMEDCKPLKHTVNCSSVPEKIIHLSGDRITNVAAETIAPPLEDDFWSGVLFASAFNGTAAASIGEPTTTNQMLNHVLTDAVSAAIYQQPLDMYPASQPSTYLQKDQIVSPNILSELHRPQVGNSIVASEFGRPAIPRQVTRNPVAVQALAVPNHVHSSYRRTRAAVSPVTPSSASMSSPPSVSFQTSPSTTAISDDTILAKSGNETPQSLHRPIVHPVSSTERPSSLTQAWSHEDRRYLPSQSPQQIGLPAASQVLGPPIPLTDFRNGNHQVSPSMGWQQFQNPCASQSGQGTNLMRSSISSSPQSQSVATQPIRIPPQISTNVSTSSSSPVIDSYRTPVVERRGRSLGGILIPITTAQDQVDLLVEQNWQPSKRMRGSITGRPYSPALGQCIIQPTLPAEASRPPPDITLPTATTPLHLQALLAHTVNSHSPMPQQNYGWAADPVVGSGVPGVLPK
ncbi:hypothetical protein Sjap_021003 [Stephania japonica]|uniref:SP-RING-type domain-containing protein n=1 Tax=Stephania japonica TaxID=461633 RepID=A0AAP0FAS4_9MAGN